MVERPDKSINCTFNRHLRCSSGCDLYNFRVKMRNMYGYKPGTSEVMKERENIFTSFCQQHNNNNCINVDEEEKRRYIILIKRIASLF